MMSIVRKLFGFCCCGDPPVDCDVCEDDFARSDGTDISTGSACGWTETSGSWSLSSGALTTSSSLAVATCNTDSTTASRIIRVSIKGPTNGTAVVRIGNHRVAVGIHSSSGAIQILDGSSTEIGLLSSLNLPADTWHDLIVCYDGSFITVLIQAKSYRLRVAASVSGLTNGLGVGFIVPAAIFFDNWSLTGNTGTGDCRCPGISTACADEICLDGELPTQMQVEASTFSGDCLGINGVYVLDNVRSGGALTCYYSENLATTYGGCVNVVCLTVAAGQINVNFGNSANCASGPKLFYRDYFDDLLDCMALDSLPLPLEISGTCGGLSDYPCLGGEADFVYVSSL